MLTTPRATSAHTPKEHGGIHRFLFRSQPLPDPSWSTRHRFIRGLAALHIPLLTALSLAQGNDLRHVAFEIAALAGVVVLASIPRLDRSTKEGLGTVAAMMSSALLVHVTAGTIESHFHFFLMLAVVSLYQSWFAFLLGIAFVVVHHGALGTLYPEEVYNHAAAIANPWLWAGIHALFVSGASVVYVIQWRLNEMARNDARSLYRTLYEGQRSLVHQLEEAATMKDELVSTVSHELRTPLTSIIGYMEMLHEVEDLDAEEARRYMQQVSRHAGRLNFLIENLMNYQAVGSGESGQTSVIDIVEEIVAHQSGYPGAEQLTFETQLEPNLFVAASDRALRLIVSNLVNNSVKYAPPSTSVEITGRRVKVSGTPVVEIAVANEGAPIRREDRERMFGAFVQLDASITRSVPGVGLGLHIVGRTVAAYEGTVDMHCADGRIVFTVRLPCATGATHLHSVA